VRDDLDPEQFRFDPVFFAGHAEAGFKQLANRMTPEIEMQLTAMDYESFLDTVYWRRVRNYVIQRVKSCERCGRPACLEVHHLTYEHRGSEWRFLEDLIAVCRPCHREIHGV
jgi:hypothetical protein